MAHAVDEYNQLCDLAFTAFATAKDESSEMTTEGLVARCAPPRRKRGQGGGGEGGGGEGGGDSRAVPIAAGLAAGAGGAAAAASSAATGVTARVAEKVTDMRQLMTRALGELMATEERIVYLGEDVEHGGYYRVSEGLKDTFGRRRCFDWPPDEASLVGAGIGIAQVRHGICECQLGCTYASPHLTSPHLTSPHLTKSHHISKSHHTSPP